MTEQADAWNPVISPEAEARFRAKFEPGNPDDCWLWTAGTSAGYGMFSLDGATRGAHRVSWLLANGPIPAGLVVDHMCFTRACVNPAHLRLLTPAANSVFKKKTFDRPPDPELTEKYLAYLANDRKYSPDTIAGYRRTYRTFPGIVAATREDVEAWWQTRMHLSNATRQVDIAAVRSFYAWCRVWEHRAPTDDPTHRINAPHIGHRVPRPVGREDLLRILAATDGPVRRAICLGAYGGLRVAEAAALTWRDIDRETHRIYIRGKGDKDRAVGLSPLLLDNLLPDVGGNVVRAGEAAWSANLLQQKVNAAIRRAGVDGTFHKLRSRYATVALASTGNLLAVSRALGHSSPATTAIYAATSDSDLDLIAEAVTR